MTAPSYVVVCLEPGSTEKSELLKQALEAQLDHDQIRLPKDLLEVQSADQFERALKTQKGVIDPPPIGVYFGSEQRNQRNTDVAARFVNNGWFILPLVEDLTRFSSLVPKALSGVNGLQLEPNDPKVVNLLLEALGLLRESRRVFISYRRSESSGVAGQLAAELSQQGYQPFLDTISVPGGAMFQPRLWDAMVDTDLVVFLDTPEALDSEWVRKEFGRAALLGIGVIHLVWPNHPGSRSSTVFSERIKLEKHDFLSRPGPDSASGKLRTRTLSRIVQTIEKLRAKAWHVRQAKLMSGFVRRCRNRATQMQIHPGRGYELTHASGENVWVVPVVGIPRSREFQRIDGLGGSTPKWLLYDDQVLSSQRKNHVNWLGKHLPVDVLPSSEVSSWLTNNC